MDKNSKIPSDEQLAAYLNRQIDAELEKPFDKQDMDYIDECNAFIDEIDGKTLPDPEIKERKLKVLYSEFAKQSDAKQHRFTSLPFRKKFALVVYAVIVIISASVLAASAVTRMSPFDLLKKFQLILER